ncbi:MAG: AmmeMemoRadiSam system radical SAM enzyme [Desulfobacteraceae bacterium]|nr:MAG: AmmeMemoRadiSam system radical SAM enzyme [Desulfobacteraceae bacterium]
MKARLFETADEEAVRCILCHHRCNIKPGHRGICQVRRNDQGTLNTLVYGTLIARHVDPIEKKPLFHFLPGSLSYSIATVGCNFRCTFCQNAEIAQMPRDREGLVMGSTCAPDAVVADALQENCQSIAYTYTEPTVYFEFALDTARIAHAYGIKNIFVTNGYMTPEALEMAAPYLDGANVDLKAFSDEFYKTQCGARLEPVKTTLRKMKSVGVWVEVTTLIIPGLNDDPEELRRLAGFLVEALGPETPWHISRFHPTYRLTDRPVTPVATLRRARQIGLKAGLLYVYTGNVPGEDGENTICPGCGAVLIERYGFTVRRNRIREDQCPHCATPLHGVFSASRL